MRVMGTVKIDTTKVRSDLDPCEEWTDSDKIDKNTGCLFNHLGYIQPSKELVNQMNICVIKLLFLLVGVRLCDKGWTRYYLPLAIWLSCHLVGHCVSLLDGGGPFYQQDVA